MGLKDIVGKIDTFLQDGAKKFEDALNNGVNSADSTVNQGMDEIRKSADSLIEKTGIKEDSSEIAYESDGVDRLSGLGEAEPNTSIGNIIRPSVGKPEEPKVGPNGEYSYGSVEEGVTISNDKEPIVIENDTTKVNLDKVVLNSPIGVVDNNVENNTSETIFVNLEKVEEVKDKKVNLEKE